MQVSTVIFLIRNKKRCNWNLHRPIRLWLKTLVKSLKEPAYLLLWAIEKVQSQNRSCMCLLRAMNGLLSLFYHFFSSFRFTRSGYDISLIYFDHRKEQLHISSLGKALFYLLQPLIGLYMLQKTLFPLLSLFSFFLHLFQSFSSSYNFWFCFFLPVHEMISLYVFLLSAPVRLVIYGSQPSSTA